MNFDSQAAKDRIFSKIRASQGRSQESKGGEMASSEAYMAQRSLGPQPSEPKDLIELFVERSIQMSSTVDVLDSSESIADALDAYLTAGQLPKAAVVWPSLQNAPWTDELASKGLCLRFGAPAGDDLVGISGVLSAVAETGTLVMASGPDTPASTHLLPETHIALVAASQVVLTMERAFARARLLPTGLPRALNFVSGPSRTGDIEQTIVLGAHGPYRVHILLLKDC